MKDLKQQFRELGYTVQFINKYWTTADYENATSLLIVKHNNDIINKEIKLTGDNKNKTAAELLKLL